MKIENNTATIKYTITLITLLKLSSTVTTEARGKTEEFKIMYDSHEGFAGDFKKMPKSA